MAGAQNKILAPMTGKNSRLVIFQESNKILLDFKSWNIKPNVTKHNDGINGADADELDFTFNYYEITGQLFDRDASWLEAYLDSLEARQANTLPLDQQGAVRFYPNDGTKRSFVLAGLTWDDFDAGNSGRAEKSMVNVGMRCTRIVKAKTIG